MRQTRRVATALVLVNGLPGAGKTTLAAGLAGELGAVLLSKDAVKEALATVLPDSVVVPDLGVVAIESVWNLAARLPGVVVVESWWFRPRDLRFAEGDRQVHQHSPRIMHRPRLPQPRQRSRQLPAQRAPVGVQSPPMAPALLRSARA
jgi:hypothetical protein